MSTTLPPESKPTAGEFDSSATGAAATLDGSSGLALGDTDVIGQLLRQQSTLSAVQAFSDWHEREVDEIAGEPAQAKYYRDLMPASPPQPGQQYAFEVDLEKCSGCKACVVACHSLNGLEETEAWRRVGTVSEAPVHDHVSTASGGSSETLPIVQHVTTACHHCEDPGCLIGCPVKAYEKDANTGIVRHLDDQCIGCKYCTMMCPYEVPRYSDRLGIVRKCDMCHQRLGRGEAPACVQACPNEAIAIGIVDRDQSFGDGDVLVPGAPESSITRPTTRYVGRSLSVDAAMPQDHWIDEPAENHWPLAALLVATQASVGLLWIERLSSLWFGSDLIPVVAAVALAIAAVGLNLAPLHLGQPARAWRVMLGLRTSWLSREAVVLGIYAAMVGLVVLLTWAPRMVPDLWQSFVPEAIENVRGSLVQTTMWAALPVGTFGLYSSAMIYIATRRGLWRASRTLIRFFGSAIILGSVAAGAVGLSPRMMGTVAILVTIAKLIWEANLLRVAPPAANAAFEKSVQEDLRSAKVIRRHLASQWRLRWVSGVVGSFLAAAGVATASHTLMIAALIVLGVGELAERLLYFSSVVYDRMPGTLG